MALDFLHELHLVQVHIAEVATQNSQVSQMAFAIGDPQHFPAIVPGKVGWAAFTGVKVA
ncbi:hypothetical protein D3C76_1639730 [compost metagenome]